MGHISTAQRSKQRAEKYSSNQKTTTTIMICLRSLPLVPHELKSPISFRTRAQQQQQHSHPFSQTLRSHTVPHKTLTGGGTATTTVANVGLSEHNDLNAAEEEEPLPSELSEELMPNHVAVIMDGNGRWAKQRGLPVSAGHLAGARSLRELVEICCKWGVRVLTVFAFSYDNWIRPKVRFTIILRVRYDFEIWIFQLILTSQKK